MTRPDVYFIGDPGDPTTFEVWDIKSGTRLQDVAAISIKMNANVGTVAALQLLNVQPFQVNVVPAPKAHKFTMADIGKAVECRDSREIVRGKISEIYPNQPNVVNVIDDRGHVWCFYDKDVELLPTTPVNTCPECKGTGTYTCALTAKESPCSLGCKP